MGTSGNKDCQRASRSSLKDFTDNALPVSAGSLFQNGTARTASLLVELFIYEIKFKKHFFLFNLPVGKRR